MSGVGHEYARASLTRTSPGGPRGRLLLALALVGAGACDRARGATEREPPVDKAVAHAGGVASDGCATCHPAIAQEWRASNHAQAWTDPLFQAEYRDTPDPACRHCHAPTAPRTREPRGLAAQDGVDCATCHIRDGALVPVQKAISDAERASWARAILDAPPGAYSTEPVAALRSAEFCGTCHQIHFLPVSDPEAVAYDPAEWLQDTYREWSQSDAARSGVSCQACHMKRVVAANGRAHTNHRFPGMYDAALVRRAVSVELTARRQGGRIHVDASVRPGAIGHAFPTGDMFREAVLTVWTVEPESARAEARLRRSFQVVARERHGDPDHMVYAGAEDTRVAPPAADAAAREFAMILRSPAARELQWSLELHARTPGREHLGGSTVVASGRVTITPDPALTRAQ